MKRKWIIFCGLSLWGLLLAKAEPLQARVITVDDDGPADFNNIQAATQNGDVNGDGKIDINDVHYLLDYLFKKGPAPIPIKTGLPVTDQTKCYNDSDNGDEIPCPQPGEPFYGQDGTYQAGIPRNFEVVKPDPNDNSSWYTIDYATGLMWQYADDDIARYWQDALRYCENLQLGGFNDWRLPNAIELESLIDYGQSDPSITPDSFLTSGSGGGYWSATTVPGWTNAALVAYFGYGGMNAEMKNDVPCLGRAVRTIQRGDLERKKTLAADLNNDGIINFKDLAKFADQWLMTELWYTNSQ